MGVRRADFSGSWYPKRADACEREILSFLDDTSINQIPNPRFVGGIVPHAGWVFSGSIACNVIHHLLGEGQPDVIVIFGTHLHPNSPAYIMKEGSWETPFGDLPIAENLAEELSKRFSFEVETFDNYIQDNTIEVQLPFIKYFFKDTRIVPIGVPPRQTSLQIGRAVAEISQQLKLNIRLVGSTDLTHYGNNYGFLPRGTGPSAVDWVKTTNDQRVINLMLDMNPEGVIEEALTQQNACCSGAAATTIAAAKKIGSEAAHKIAYATSYDKQPDDSFVGYAGIVF